MQDLLTTYLFQNKNCPLPGIGSLQLKEAAATVVSGEQKIIASMPGIEFTKEEIPSSGLTKYISAEQHITEEQAAATLKQYCSKLKFLGSNEEVLLTEAGKFTVSAEGNLIFIPLEIEAAYQPAVHAEKVIRPNDTHSMLVGDTETTNTVMTEFYSEDGRSSRNRWWIWAMILFAVAAIVIGIYYGSTANSGNLNPQPAGNTYTPR